MKTQLCYNYFHFKCKVFVTLVETVPRSHASRMSAVPQGYEERSFMRCQYSF